MKKNKLILLLITLALISNYTIIAQNSHRQRVNIDNNWRFALGHFYDTEKDFNNRTSYFSYFAKAGYGDGAAAPGFDDRAWRVLNLPHDWCVELPFAANGSHSHGYKAMGLNYPQNSVGWYRKNIFIPETDLGSQITIEFDGAFRNSIVWVNGFYCGTAISGYTPFTYNITDYINYGGQNTIAVRCDAFMEEGWYYEGAGIYRHVWLNKTMPLHVAQYGTFVTTTINQNQANIEVRTTVNNNYNKPVTFNITENIIDANGKTIATAITKNLKIGALANNEFYTRHTVNNPVLWSLKNPYLHTLQTIITVNDTIIDSYNTTFGIRTVKFDANKGFFLNNENIKIVGTNLHQDHAGVGMAVPDALYDFRIKKLQEMGNNGIRTSHEPPSPAFLDACDRLGMLVLNENRLMGSNNEHLNLLERFMKRDRNHPSVVLWSLGNEEWAIEGNIKGARIAQTMQNFAQKLDSSRAFTAACSGGWDNGIGMVTQVMGYNYIVQGNIDQHHAKFPWQAGIGTEESNTVGTRGIYQTNSATGHLAPTNRMPENVGTQSGWQFYAERPFLAGLFFWTGFDYRGEPSPYAWPAVNSQFGIVDLCGFPKDIFYYLKAWWGNQPVLHIATHWNWQGLEGKERNVLIYSNCEQVELLFNNKVIDKKDMPVNGHLLFTLPYKPGTLLAKGYNNGKLALTQKVETTGNASQIQLIPDKQTLAAAKTDVAVITVQTVDKKNRIVPTANNNIIFDIEGPAQIIGVGNGDPSSHAPERFFETIVTPKIDNLIELPVNNLDTCPQVFGPIDKSNWKPAFKQNIDWNQYIDTLIVVRGTFSIDSLTTDIIVNLFTKSIVHNQSVYVNGHTIAKNIERDAPGQSFRLDKNILKQGQNIFAVTGQRFRKTHKWDEPNTDPGSVQIIYKAKPYNRHLFNGFAQVIVQTNGQKGDIKITAKANGLLNGTLVIKAE